jgi:hypothetical protein
MTNAEVAALILVVYAIPGLLIAWATWNSKEFGETIDGYSAFEQFLFVACNVLLWPVVLVKAVAKFRQLRHRKRR